MKNARRSFAVYAITRHGIKIAQRLMPGLTEPHAHATFPDAASIDDFTGLPPEEHTLVSMHNARTFLECGYTSCLSAASAKPRLDVAIRNEIDAGRIPGPRYLANGPEITVTGWKLVMPVSR